MAKRAKRLVESWAYVPRAERALPAEEQTLFRLRPMTQSERLTANDDLVLTTNAPDGSQIIASRARIVARRLCLQHIESVENFPAGDAVPWPTERTEREKYLETMDDELVHEVGNEVFTRSGIGELEKNS